MSRQEACPFCGAPGKVISCMGEWFNREIGYGPDGKRIVCSTDNCTGALAMGAACYGDDAEALAWASWNTRIQPSDAGQTSAEAANLYLTWASAQGYRGADWNGVEPSVQKAWRAVARAALALSPAEPAGWQDIASVPRDRAVDLWHHKQYRLTNCRYIIDRKRHGGLTETGWVDREGRTWPESDFTHFMVPAPPAPGAS